MWGGGDQVWKNQLVVFLLKLTKFWVMLLKLSLFKRLLDLQEKKTTKKQAWKKTWIKLSLIFTICPGNSSMPLQVASYPIRNFVFLSESWNTNWSSAMGLP